MVGWRHEPERPAVAGRGPVTPDPPDWSEIDETGDSWEPPHPALGGPGQLFAAVVAAIAVAVALIGVVALLSWLFR